MGDAVMWAEIIDGAVTATRNRLPSSLRRADTDEWVCPPDGEWTTEQAALCGWFPVAEAEPAPSVSASDVAVLMIVAVDGVPVPKWEVRAKTADELAADEQAALMAERALHLLNIDDQLRAASAATAAYLARSTQTTAQNTAQIRNLSAAVDALIRRVLGV